MKVIFSEADHIQQIIAGSKTQTRRASDRYQIGKTYAIQPCRTCKGIPEGRILITAKRLEHRRYEVLWTKDCHSITPEDALAEGGYTQDAFYLLYKKMDSDWKIRYAYTFKFVPSKQR